MEKLTREQLVSLVEEINTIMSMEISTKANVSNAKLEQEIRKAGKELVSTDFDGSDPDSCFSKEAIETFKALNIAIPEPEKVEEKKAEKAKKTEEKAAKKANKKEEKKFTRSDAAMLSIRELCKKGATLQEIVDRTDEIYVENGGHSVPDAVNVNKYCLNGLVEFNVLELNDKKYKFIKKEKA